MSLIKCPECGKDISDTAKACPECGFDMICYFQMLQQEKENKIAKEKANAKNEKIVSILKNKKVQLSFLLILALVIIGSLFYNSTHIEVINGITWGMTVPQVLDKANSLGGTDGYYDEKNNYYGLADVDYLGEVVNMLYIFEEDKLESIAITPNLNMYESAYQIAYGICKEYNLPVSFTDKTDEYLSTSFLKWNIKGTTIELFGSYNNSASYTFMLKPYDGSEFGDNYANKGICNYGSESLNPCKNEITPWGEDDTCFKHGCYVIGCPNMLQNKSNTTMLCDKHYFLAE